jgi:hypothetical protein
MLTPLKERQAPKAAGRWVFWVNLSLFLGAGLGLALVPGKADLERVALGLLGVILVSGGGAFLFNIAGWSEGAAKSWEGSVRYPWAAAAGVWRFSGVVLIVAGAVYVARAFTGPGAW